MAGTSQSHSRIRIAEIVPAEYSDFLLYCRTAGILYADDVTPMDFAAYRVQSGREKEDADRLQDLLQAGGKPEPEAAPAKAPQDPGPGGKAALPELSAGKETAGSAEETRVSRPEKPVPKLGLQPTYAEELGVNPEDYAGMTINGDLPLRFSIRLSARSENWLIHAGYDTLEKLYRLTPQELADTQHLGRKSIGEIEEVLFRLSRSKPVLKAEPQFVALQKDRLIPAATAMLSGEEYPLDGFPEEEKAYLAKMQEAAEGLGKDFCLELIHGDNYAYVQTISEALREFCSCTAEKKSLLERAEQTVRLWDPALSDRPLRPFVRLYCFYTAEQIPTEFEKLQETDATVGRYLSELGALIAPLPEIRPVLVRHLNRFQAWMGQIWLQQLCEKMFLPYRKKKDRNIDILRARVAGKTLGEIGQQYGLTRERVRQIERRVLYAIKDAARRTGQDLLALIAAYRDCTRVLTKEDISETIGPEYGQLLWHCATRPEDKGSVYLMDSEAVHYDKDLNALLLFSSEDPVASGEQEQNRVMEQILDSLPDVLLSSDLKLQLAVLARKNQVPGDLLALTAAKRFRSTGYFSYKGRLTVVQMCDIVLKECFPKGYKVADENDGRKFQKSMLKFFGENGRMTCRAIDAKVGDSGVLIDRGKYIHRDYIHVDKSIVDRVFAYIEHSPKTAITYAELYTALSDLFVGTQITNRYILQGVMKLYGCPVPSHRDYVSKGQNINVADELSAFVAKQGIVHTTEMLQAFPGWSPANLGLVLPRCPEVLGIDNGYYMHASRLDVTEEDRRCIKEYLEETIQEYPVSAAYLMKEFQTRFPDFLRRNEIDSKGKLFGILQYLYAKDFHFSRPFVEKENQGKITRKTVLMQHLTNMNLIGVEDLFRICRQNGIHFVAVTSLLEMLQPEFVRVNATLLMRIESIGLEESMYADIVDRINESVAAHDGYCVSGTLRQFKGYPTLKVRWTPFLLESIAAILPGGIHRMRIPSYSYKVSHTIFVSDEYADDDWNSLLLKLLKERHKKTPFADKSAILNWLVGERLSKEYPSFLDNEGHVFQDENGILSIQ